MRCSNPFIMENLDMIESLCESCVPVREIVSGKEEAQGGMAIGGEARPGRLPMASYGVGPESPAAVARTGLRTSKRGNFRAFVVREVRANPPR